MDLFKPSPKIADDAQSTKEPKTRKPWNPDWLPNAIFSVLCVMLIFIIVGVVVSGLVLGGTVQVKAKAIGLTQSLVLFSSIFGVAYICLHIYAARKAQFQVELRLDRRHPLHTKTVLLGRIATSSWTIALVAVGITLGSVTKAKDETSLGPLRADLAACLVNSLAMGLLLLVIARVTEPYILPWITPAVQDEKQTKSAKSLIKDILGDGIAGRPFSAFKDSEKADDKKPETRKEEPPLPPTPPPPAPPTPPPPALATPEKAEPATRAELASSDSTDDPVTTIRSPNQPTATNISQTYQTVTSPAMREQWNQVDEGGAYGSTTNLLQDVTSLPKIKPRLERQAVAERPPRPSRPYAYTPSKPDRTGYERISTIPSGARPLYSPTTALSRRRQHQPSTNPHKQYLPYRPPEQRSNRIIGPRPGPAGKNLFNKAVEGLKYQPTVEDVPDEEWATGRIPGSFV